MPKGVYRDCIGHGREDRGAGDPRGTDMSASPTTPVFEGCVPFLPPLKPGEKMVLGQILSRETVKAYDIEKARWAKNYFHQPLVELISKPGELSANENFRQKAEELVTTWISKHLVKKGKTKTPKTPEAAKAFLNSLPEDIPVSHKVQKRRVGDDDPRVPLRGEWGCIAGMPEGRKHEPVDGKAFIQQGEPLGPYRGQLLFTYEYRNHKTKPHKDFPGSMLLWKNKCDSYGVDIHFKSRTLVKQNQLSVPGKVAIPNVMKSGAAASGREAPSGSKKRAKDLDGGDIMEYEFVSSAFMVGNLMGLVNDPTKNPLDEGHQLVRSHNVTVMEVRVGAWIFPIMIAEVDIHEGEELAYCYGHSYWETFADQQLDIQYTEGISSECTRLKKERATLLGRVKELEAELADFQPMGHKIKHHRQSRAIICHGSPHGALSTVQGGHITSHQPPLSIKGPSHADSDIKLECTTPAPQSSPTADPPGRDCKARKFLNTGAGKRARLNPENETPLKLKEDGRIYARKLCPGAGVPEDTIGEIEAAGGQLANSEEQDLQLWWPKSNPDREHVVARAAAYHGVVARPKTGMYDAVIHSQGKLFWLGSYKYPKQAAIAVDLMKRQLQDNKDQNFPSLSTETLVKNGQKIVADLCAKQKEACKKQQESLDKILERLMRPVLGMGEQSLSKDTQAGRPWQNHPTASRSHRLPNPRRTGTWKASFELVEPPIPRLNLEPSTSQQEGAKPVETEVSEDQAKAAEQDTSALNGRMEKSKGGKHNEGEKRIEQEGDAEESATQKTSEQRTHGAAEKLAAEGVQGNKLAESSPISKKRRLDIPEPDIAKSPDTHEDTASLSKKSSIPNPVSHTPVTSKQESPKPARPASRQSCLVNLNGGLGLSKGSNVGRHSKSISASDSKAKKKQEESDPGGIGSKLKSLNGTTDPTPESGAKLANGKNSKATVSKKRKLEDTGKSQLETQQQCHPASQGTGIVSNFRAVAEQAMKRSRLARTTPENTPTGNLDSKREMLNGSNKDKTVPVAGKIGPPRDSTVTAPTSKGKNAPVSSPEKSKGKAKGPEKEGNATVDKSSKSTAETPEGNVLARRSSLADEPKRDSIEEVPPKHSSRLREVLKSMQLKEMEQAQTIKSKQQLSRKVLGSRVNVTARRTEGPAKRPGDKKPTSPVRTMGNLTPKPLTSKSQGKEEKIGSPQNSTLAAAPLSKEAASKAQTETSKARKHPVPNPDMLIKIGSHNGLREKLPFRESGRKDSLESRASAPTKSTSGHQVAGSLPARTSVPVPASRPQSPQRTTFQKPQTASTNIQRSCPPPAVTQGRPATPSALPQTSSQPATNSFLRSTLEKPTTTTRGPGPATGSPSPTVPGNTPPTSLVERLTSSLQGNSPPTTNLGSGPTPTIRTHHSGPSSGDTPFQTAKSSPKDPPALVAETPDAKPQPAKESTPEATISEVDGLAKTPPSRDPRLRASVGAEASTPPQQNSSTSPASEVINSQIKPALLQLREEQSRSKEPDPPEDSPSRPNDAPTPPESPPGKDPSASPQAELESPSPVRARASMPAKAPERPVSNVTDLSKDLNATLAMAVIGEPKIKGEKLGSAGIAGVSKPSDVIDICDLTSDYGGYIDDDDLLDLTDLPSSPLAEDFAANMEPSSGTPSLGEMLSAGMGYSQHRVYGTPYRTLSQTLASSGTRPDPPEVSTALASKVAPLTSAEWNE